jgi:hypothetical protein
VEPIKYITSLLTFYLKGEIKAEQNFIEFKVPNTVLGVIPLGAKSDRLVINQIASTSTNFKLRLWKLLIGIVFVLSALLSFSIIWLAISVNILLTAFETDLVVTTTAGQQKVISFFVFEREKADLASRQINAMIGDRMYDTNVRQQTDRIVDAINNK